MTGTIQGTTLLGLSSAPVSGVVYRETNPGGSSIAGMVLQNVDTVAAAGSGRTIAVTISKQAAGGTTSVIWSGSLTPGQSVTIGGAVLAQGDSIIGTATFGGLVSIEIDGTPSPDVGTQALIAQNIMLEPLVGGGVPGPSATAGGVLTP